MVVRRLLAVSAVSAALVISREAASPQEPSSPVRETAEAVLVEVPVRVVDRDGNPVRNLRAEDFELWDDGRKQTIVGFDAIDLAEKTPVASGPARVHPAARRHFLLLFDFSFARPKAIVAARSAAKEFVLNAMGDRDLAAVATYSVEKGVNLLVTFTPDRVQLARAIETLGIAAPVDSADPLAFAFDLRHWKGEGGQSPRGATEAQAAVMIETLQTIASISRARLDQYARSRVTRLTESFSNLAQALNAVAGRKDVIYLSEGFESRLLVGTRDSDQERDWIVSGEQWKVDSDKRFGNSPLRARIEAMGGLFRRSDCVIHAVDIGGLRSDPEASSLEAQPTENSLFEIASSTGGEVFRNDNDFHAQLARLITRTSLVYVLAFRPERTGNEGTFHDLKVKVRARGARVSARAGYYERKAFRSLSPLERSLAAADVVANEIPVADIPAQVLAVPFAAGEDSAAVPLLVEIPGEPLLVGQKGDRLTVEIYAYASDEENRLRDFFVQAVSVDLARNRQKLLEGGLKYCGELALPAGRYRLRVLVRSAETGRMGLTVLPLRVPKFAEREPYLLSPIFLRDPASGIFVRGPAKTAGGKGSVGAGSPLFEVSGNDHHPAALLEIEKGQSSSVSLVAYNFGPAAQEDPLEIGAHVLAADGRPLGESSLRILGRQPVDASGRRVLLLGFTPEGLGPGRYSLRVFVRDTATGQAGHSSAQFVLR